MESRLKSSPDRLLDFDLYLRFRTALHYAVEQSSANCTRLLTSFGGADPNLPDASSLTALHYCALYNSDECLQELLDSPTVKVQVLDQNKRLPLHYAAASGNLTILSSLIDVGRIQSD